MFSNLQIYRTLAKKERRMNESGKTVSNQAMEDEWKLIQSAQADRRHFRALYNHYYEPIFRFVFRRTADRNLAADLCSQVFLKAMQKLDKYQYKGVPFSAWLYRIASNEVAQHFRNQQKNRVVSIEEHHFSDLADESDVSKTEDLQPKMIEALDQLKETDLALIEMRFFEKLPFKEIAEILEITESNAKVKTYRILERLKKHIGTSS